MWELQKLILHQARVDLDNCITGTGLMEEIQHISGIQPEYMLLSSTIVIPKYVSQSRALQFSSVFGISLAIGSFLMEGMASLYCFIFMGFGTALLCGASWGGSVLPVFFGRLIDANPEHPQNAILVVIPFCMVMAFSSRGFRLDHCRQLTLKRIRTKLK